MTEASRAVFLSYASQDAEAAKRICDALRAAGIEVWFDQSELRGGEAWDRHITQQIRECALFLAVISAHTEERSEGYFRREWRIAVERMRDMADDRTFLVPVVIDSTPENTARVPDRFREFQWLRLPGGEAPPAAVEQVRRLLASTVPLLPTQRATDEGSDADAVASGRDVLGRKARNPLWPALSVLACLVLAGGAYLLLHRYAVSERSVDGSRAIREKSVAVLPFSDFSEKHDQEYFADGLAEEVLERLKQVPGLRVPARASSFYFKGRSERPAAIASELGVAHLLEGTVRRAGDRVRVSVELVRGESGDPVWSSTYDRNVRDIFAVQDEVASAVVDALKLRLAPAAASDAARRTDVPAAYDQFLLGRYLYRKGGNSDWKAAMEAFRRATELDSNFAPAYVGLGVVEYLWANDYDPANKDAAIRGALGHADRAIELAPDLVDGYSSRAFLRMTAKLDIDGANADIMKALALDPSDPATHRRAGFLHAVRGDLTAAIAEQRLAVKLDPLDTNSLDALATALDGDRQGPAARAEWLRVRSLSPDFDQGLHATVGLSLMYDGLIADARRECAAGTDERSQICLAVLDGRDGRREASRAALESIAVRGGARLPFDLARAYALLGDRDRCFTWLERAYLTRDRYFTHLVEDRGLASVREDPRFRALLREMNLAR